MAKLVSKTYGEALFELAMEENRAQEMLEEIIDLQTALSENPDFDKLMKHPGVPKQEKLQMIREVFKDRVSNELAGFLEIVVSKERYNDLPGIFGYFTDKVKESHKIGVAFVASAVELTKEQKELLRQLDDSLEGKSSPKRKKFFDAIKDLFD